MGEEECLANKSYWQQLKDEYEAEKTAKEKLLEEYRNDYGILCTQQDVIAQLVVVTKNTDFIIDCIHPAIDKITETVSKDQAPSYKEVFDFSDFNSASHIDEVDGFNTDYAASISKVGSEIDNLKTEMAIKIKDTKFDIDILIDRINTCNTNINSLYC